MFSCAVLSSLVIGEGQILFSLRALGKAECFDLLVHEVHDVRSDRVEESMSASTHCDTTHGCQLPQCASSP